MSKQAWRIFATRVKTYRTDKALTRFLNNMEDIGARKRANLIVNRPCLAIWLSYVRKD